MILIMVQLNYFLRNRKKDKMVERCQSSCRGDESAVESQDVFVKHLLASKSYLAMLQTGLPEDLLKYLENPDQFQIVEASDCVKDSVESVAQSNSHLPSRESQ